MQEQLLNRNSFLTFLYCTLFLDFSFVFALVTGQINDVGKTSMVTVLYIYIGIQTLT